MPQDKKNRITTSVKLDLDISKHIKDNKYISNFSEWINETYRKTFMTISGKVIRLQKLLDDVNMIRDDIAEQKKEIEDCKLMFDAKEMKWLNRAYGNIYVRREGNFEGHYMTFVKMFARKNINRRQFRLIMEEIAQEVGQNGEKGTI